MNLVSGGRDLKSEILESLETGQQLISEALQESMDALREGVELTREFHGQEGWDSYLEKSPKLKRMVAVLAAFDGNAQAFTPSSKWAANGEPDPHGNQYECERAALTKGYLTDDELANAIFVCDHRTSLDSIVWLTAAKDRIRWLSRRLAEATEKSEQLPR